MIGLTRRGLLSGTAAALVARPASLLAAPDPRSADLVVRNARVYTMEPSAPQAQAFAVRDGRIVAVGNNDAFAGLAGAGTEVFDARGMTVVPGFIDCHLHPDGETLLYDVLVGNPYEVEFVTIDSIVAKLKERAAKTPPGEWVEGFFYDDTKVKDGRLITRADLDRVSTDHPVAVHHRGGHTAFYNSKAFAIAGITRETPDPFGGTFDKDSSGELSGRVTDNAMDAVEKTGRRPQYSSSDKAARAKAGLAHLSKQFVRYGLTTVHHEGGDFSALMQVRTDGDLLHRVSYEPDQPMIDAMIANGWRTGFGDEWIRLGAASEHVVDGSFSERTMGIRAGYPGRNPPYHGNVTTTQADLDAWVEQVWRAGIQPNCHTNGDVAIGMYLTSLERAQQLFPRRDVRPKFTHATLAYPDLIARMKALDAVPACFTSYAYYNPDKFKFYGETLMEHMMPYRSYLDAGIKVAGGCDFSPGPFAPLMGIQGMVTRTGWNGETWGANQRISVDEALRVYTWNGAYNSHEEQAKGSIAPGKLADFVVLSDDPHTVAPDKIKDIRIVRTVTGGRTTHLG
ncbi:MAG TPA: amidohydrolase [Sphingomicrobium sp.]|nr:amidohydrolase [Sphingomicrobium sp.]